MEDREEKTPTSKIISRRDFLKITGLAAGAAAAGAVASRLGIRSSRPEEVKSPEIKLNSSVSVLDYFDLDEVKNRYLQNIIPYGFSETESLRAMGVDDPTNREELLRAEPQSVVQYRLLMLLVMLNQYQDHGERVVETRNRVEQLFSETPKKAQSQISIANAVEIKQFGRDDLNNPVIHFMVNPKTIDNLVKSTPDSVINMSFEPGSNSFTFEMYDYPIRNLPTKQKGVVIRDSDGNVLSEGQPKYFDHSGKKISEDEYNRLLKEAQRVEPVLLPPKDRNIDYVDGYYGVNATDNVKKLAEIARNHPEKIFVAAGGNPTGMEEIPDIIEIRSELEKKGLWPRNLIIVGFETNLPDVFVGPASYGADIYVSDQDLEELGLTVASSYATPVVSEIVRQVIINGENTHQKAKESLIQMTEVKKAWRKSEEIEYRLLNLDKAKDILKLESK